MKQPIPLAKGIRELSILATFAALLVAVQVGLSFLPNIELVSLLILLMVQKFGWKSLLPVWTFALVEGLIFGFHIWWINYLYIWPIWVLLIMLFKKSDHPLLLAILAGIFGLLFGSLCSLPYFLTGGWGAGFGYIISGIPFDLIHGVSNFILVLLLYRPLSRCLQKILK